MVNEAVRLGFDRDMLVDSIRGRCQNKATVTYYLMCDNRKQLPSSGYLRSELSETAPPLPGVGLTGMPPGQMPGKLIFYAMLLQ